MGDLIGNAKEFAKEMEQYLQLQRAADKAKRDADAKYDKLAAFLRVFMEACRNVCSENGRVSIGGCSSSRRRSTPVSATGHADG